MIATPHDRVAEVPPRRIPYRDWGHPTGHAPDLVLLHGLFGNSHEWDTVARSLADRRRVIVPDQRGHGIAGWASDYTAARLVSDLAGLVDTLGLDTFDLAGHSMGGIVSMLYASSHPERVRRLVVIDIGPESLSDQDNRDGFLQMLSTLRQARYADPAAAVDEWLAMDPLARPAETANWARHALRREPDGRWAWRVDLDGIGQFLTEPPPREALWAAVAQIRAHTLVIHGEHSWALPEPAARTLAARLRHGTATRLDGFGHDLGVQAPEQVASRISAFRPVEPWPRTRSEGARSEGARSEVG